MVSKACPKCKQQVPVACKACPCGHVFFVARRPISIHKIGGHRNDDANGGQEGEVKCRRTERTRRERPDYFNSLKIENQVKLQRKQRQRTGNSTSSTNEEGGEGSNSEGSISLVTGKKRGRPKGTPKKKEEEVKNVEKEEDMFANLPAEKALQYSVILAEINRKWSSQQFKV